MGSLLIHNITAKLTAGWNPWVNAEKSRQFTEIPIIFSRYRDYVKTMTDKNAMKEKKLHRLPQPYQDARDFYRRAQRHQEHRTEGQVQRPSDRGSVEETQGLSQ